MAKLTQTLKTITADFSKIENQYQNNTFDIEVELTDETFKDYIVMLSINNPQHYTEAYPIPIINGVAKLPYYCTDYLGTTTISLFGYKVDSDDIITTNKIDVEVVASNPTNIYYAPDDDNWANIMKAYVDSMIDALGEDITPSISEDGYWYIGDVNTGIKADGTSEDYYTKYEVDEIINDVVDVQEITLSNTTDTSFNVSVSGITANDSPILDIKMSGTTENMQTLQEEWSKVLNAVTGNGIITFTLSEPLSKTITVLVKGV